MAFALKNKRSRTNAEIFTREFTSVRQGIAFTYCFTRPDNLKATHSFEKYGYM